MSHRYDLVPALLAGAALSALFAGSGAEAAALSPATGGLLDSSTAVAMAKPVTGPLVAPAVAMADPVLASVAEALPVLAGPASEVGNITTSLAAKPSPSARIFVKPSVPITSSGGKIRSFGGKIRSFNGEELTPFWGKIRSFWGDDSPFDGDLTQFWGDLQPYDGGEGKGNSRVTPEWGKIRSFWGDVGAQWGKIRSFWDTAGTAEDYASLASQFNDVLATSATFWGPAVEAQTGKSFQAGFADALLSRYGLDTADPGSFARLDAEKRDAFFLDWYDSLMQFSGSDNPDYWMKQVGWTPKITQIMGQGRDSVIGLLDFTVNDRSAGKIKTYNGTSDFDNGHGAAVASLMVAPHDGRGIMGMAPRATVVAYNPFDETETAGWSDIKAGITELGKRNASIINMSLGVAGWTLHPEWNAVFTDYAVASATRDSVFVVAAGNDGISQSSNIAWSNNANFIVVGSVDPSSQISDFSNRPGSACLLTYGRCRSGDELMNRFIVAPGEFLLVSDGKGGVTRLSGTSFAAPLVSGTIALIHDRWPWLAKYPKETVDIVLKSATDLGAPGIDPVYGAGMLNVVGAISPLNLDRLIWFAMDDKRQIKPMTSAMVRAQGAGNLGRWEASGMYFHAFESIGFTLRDFLIPLSSKLVDQSVLAATGSKEQFQAYLHNQVADWIRKGFTSRGAPSLNIASVSSQVVNPYGLNVSMSLAPRTLKRQLRAGEMPWQTALNISDEDGRFGFQVGHGDGAVELGNNLGFGRAGDYDPASGGANPVLGMASGGAFVQARHALSDKLSLSAGFTEQAIRYRRRDMSIFELGTYAQLNGYSTSAGTIALSYRPNPVLELTGSYTRLGEKNALLGLQAVDPSLLGKGSSTDAMTLGLAWDAMPTLRIAASGTVGRTTSDRTDALISTGGRGFISTAYQLSLTKQHLFDRADSVRFSIAQPLHVEDGALSVTSVKVIDRETGELGASTQRFTLGKTKRPLVGEFAYSRALLGDSADLAFFGKAQLAGDPVQYEAARLLAGARFTLRY